MASSRAGISSIYEMVRKRPRSIAGHEVRNLAQALIMREMNELPAIEQKISTGSLFEEIYQWEESLAKAVARPEFETVDKPDFYTVREDMVHIQEMYEAAHSLFHCTQRKAEPEYSDPLDSYITDILSSSNLEDSVKMPRYAKLGVTQAITNSDSEGNNVVVDEADQIPDLLEEESDSLIVTDDGNGLPLTGFGEFLEYDPMDGGGLGLPLLKYLDEETEMAVKYIPPENRLKDYSGDPEGLHDSVYIPEEGVPEQGCTWYFESQIPQ